MPFRNTFRDKIKRFVSATQTQKAISQRHAELDDTVRSDSSTIDTHLQTKTIYCLVIFNGGRSALLSSSCHLIRYGKFSHFLCVCIQMMVAMEETNTDQAKRDQSLFLTFCSHSESWSFFFPHISSASSCRYVQVQNNGEHFGGNTFCITFGSFSLLRLISSLYYTVLDILL